MTDRDQLLDYCNELLNAAAFSDYGPNGLQVEGASEVTAIATAVSTTHDVIERAARAGANLLLTHHGLFWKSTPQVIDGVMRARIGALIENNMTLASYHLPLDAHPEIGNNALLARGLNVTVDNNAAFVVHDGQSIGLVGSLAAAVDRSELASQVAALLDRAPLVLGPDSGPAQRIAICSGGAGYSLEEAARLGADVFITGEPTENARAIGMETGTTMLAAGHDATERLGIRALGERVADKFGLSHVFLEEPNPV